MNKINVTVHDQFDDLITTDLENMRFDDDFLLIASAARPLARSMFMKPSNSEA